MSSFDFKSLEDKKKVSGTILLLQSSAAECEQLRAPLTDIGFTVLGTTKPQEALQFYEKNHPDVMIVSAFLSTGTPMEFCREIRIKNQDQKTPIILTSAFPSGTLFIEARSKWGVNDVVILPTKMKKILHLILFHMGMETTRPKILDDPSEEPLAPPVPLPVKAQPKKILASKGVLAEIGLDRLLRLMWTNKRTGLLKVGSDEAVIRFHIADGKLAFVSSGYIQGYSLADHLQRENLVASDYLPAIIKRMLEEKKLLGHLLLKVGLIEKDALDDALRAHILKKALLPFKWDSGQYSYKNENVQPPSDVRIEFHLAKVILEGVRGSVDPDSFEKEYKNLAGTIFRHGRAPDIDAKRLDLTPDEKRLLHAMDGSRPLSELLNMSKMQTEDITRFVAGLLALHLIRPVEEPISESF